jgi:hypothetical protein
MTQKSLSAEEFLRDKYKLVDFAGLTINGVKWTDLMEEYASQKKEKEDVEKLAEAEYPNEANPDTQLLRQGFIAGYNAGTK